LRIASLAWPTHRGCRNLAAGVAPVNPRYAIYFVPAADSALYRFGAAVLGYDCYTGNDTGFPDPLPMENAAWRDLTGEPRRYGFHATLKAPFHLAENADETALIDAFPAFCRSVGPAPVIEPIVASLAGFIAIVPTAADPAIDRLAAACVTAFDRFRAPLNARDRGRRMIGLSERQVGNLDRWGYPFVFDDFRLHLTLTGRLGPERNAEILPYLRDRFAAACGARPVSVDRIALLRQDRPDARFLVIRHAAIGADQ
jgi:putative phosphonate metabolism protein